MMSLLLLVAVVLVASMVEVFESAGPWLGVLVPFVVAFVAKAEATPTTKFVTALVITGGVGVASIALQNWDEFTWRLLAERILIAVGEAQVIYFAVSAAVDRWTDKTSINQLHIFGPAEGSGPAHER